MPRHPFIRLAPIFLFLFLGADLLAQDKQDEEGKKRNKFSLEFDDPQGEGDMGNMPVPEFPPFESIVTPEFERIDGGYYTLYRNKNVLYAEVPEFTFGTPFLLATSIAGGDYMGWQWDDMALYWERNDRMLVLFQPEVRYRASESKLAEAVHKTYTDGVVASTPILCMGNMGPVIDLGGLYSWSAGKFVPYLGSFVDASLVKIDKVKCFPQNVEVALAMPGGFGGFSFDGGGAAKMMTIHYSLSQIPETGYQPREADDRIGYFLTVAKDFDKLARDGSRFVRYVNRWQLQKADPSLEVSPPLEPIIFYIEKTVPVQYRRYVREGILEWNKAFEKCGITGAMEVRQQTDSNEYATRDPEDVRYNFFRWITSDAGFAMGPSRVNPWTGQILDADIIFDDAMVLSFLQDYDLMIAQAKNRFVPPHIRDFLDKHPERDPSRFWKSRKPAPASITIPHQERMRRIVRGRESCQFGTYLAHQLAVAGAFLNVREDGESPLDAWPEEFVGQVVKEIVMHEVGHTLGLRHNFKGSSWRKLGDINAETGKVDDIGGSVMDYNPVNVSLPGKAQGRYMMTTVGPYDYWAIEYGYSEEDPAAILQRVAEPGLAYATDEDLYSPDPLVNVWDLGDEPIAYAQQRMSLVKKLQEDFIDRVVREGQSYERARRAFDMLLFDYLYSGLIVAKYVGGQYIHRDHKGDPNGRQPVEIVPAAKQKEALKFLCDNVFTDKPFQFDPALLNQLAKSHWSHWGSSGLFQDDDYPIHDRVLVVQLYSLFEIINPWTLGRIYDAELKVDPNEDALTLADLFDTLTNSIFGSVFQQPQNRQYTNRKPLISNIMRNLQREFVGELIWNALQADAGYAPRTARTLCWFELKRISKGIDDLLRGGIQLDTYTRSHLEETKERIDRAVQAGFELK